MTFFRRQLSIAGRFHSNRIEREDTPKVVATARIVDTLIKREGTFKVRRHQVEVDPGMFKAFQASQS